MIPQSFIDDLISRVDIVDVVSEYVRLTKRSGKEMLGLCPFHSEKTPSFYVSPDKQVYHCFGCGKGGGVINFLMEIENYQYIDVLAALAKRVGMTLPDDGATDELANKRQRMLHLNRDAARHFHEMLMSPMGVTARDYLAMRGLGKEVITKFGIGAAPDSWYLLMDSMIKKGYTKTELIEAGLAKNSRKESSIYDHFRNRVMFPIIDVRSNVIGFSGRILDDGAPKYLNSPDTLVFNKSRNLFALNLARKSKSGMMILVEGNIDVVALHQAGFDGAVAALGTSMTAEQARLMSQYANKVVIAFDSDHAGKKAALRAIPLVEKTGMEVKVVDLGVAKDPDDFLKKHGHDAFALLLDHSENHISYRFLSLKSGYDLSTDEGRVAYVNAATTLLSELSSKPEREIYSVRVAQDVGISQEAVQNEAEKKYRARIVRQRKDYEKKVTKPREAVSKVLSKQFKEKNADSVLAEEGVVRMLIKDPTLVNVIDEMDFTNDEFTSLFLKHVYEMITKRIAESKDTGEQYILPELDIDGASRLTKILSKIEVLVFGEKTLRDYIERIREEKSKLAKFELDRDLFFEIREAKLKQFRETEK
ncbi:MAG: DNA primase [Oscillospiraceae bacterium]|nr:DNA primase [Oscillospiraceae bacterium]